MKESTVPNVVQSFRIEGTTIKIADNYCRDVTEEEVERILARISQKIQPCLVLALEKERSEMKGA